AIWQLRIALSEGRLSDPAQRAFARWPGPGTQRSLWYSTHQLLGLRGLRWLQARLEGERRDSRVVWTTAPLSKRDRESFARQRSLAMVLEALSPRYWPRVLGVIRGYDESVQAHVNGDELIATLDAIGVPIGMFVRQADLLLASAGQFDPLGSWSRVTRVGNRRRWDELRHDALLAQEYRVAAEALLQHVEAEARHGRMEPLQALSESWKQPQHDRLKFDDRERGETIMDFKLAQPALFIAVEGETEEHVVRRTLELAGFDRLSTRISVVNRKSVDGDVRLLARALAVPHADPDGYSGARVLSPLTALIVVSDPEKRFATESKRATLKEEMIASVLETLPPQLRSDAMERDLDHLVHVRAWPAEFEFAHFSNTELARAAKRIAGRAAPTEKEIRARLKRSREAGGAIKSVWKNWVFTPSKVQLAEELWPVLEARILNERTRRGIPVADLVLDAIDMTHEIEPVRELAPEED
ncbi:MAG: hypothetical protein ACR2OD_09420, partial [Gaiellaceae bacterium]